MKQADCKAVVDVVNAAILPFHNILNRGDGPVTPAHSAALVGEASPVMHTSSMPVETQEGRLGVC